MQIFGRIWRRKKPRRGSHDAFNEEEEEEFSLPTRDDSRPIDSHDQEKLVRSLERTHAQQSLVWRSVFAGMIFCYVAFLIYSAYQQAYYPWELRYHAYFMYEVDSGSIILADCAAILVCLMSMKGLIHNTRYHQRWLWSSCCSGALLAIFWLNHMFRLASFRWDIIWLPFGPISGALICLYVDHLLYESSEEIRKLRGYMYAFKAS